MINRPAKLQRTIKQIRLNERERLVALVLADLEFQRQALALAEQVIGRVIDADERARQSADAARQTDTVLTLFVYLQQ